MAKECAKCLQTLPNNAFNKDNSKSDGLQSYCRECSKLAKKRHYQDNKKIYYKRSQRRRNEIKNRIHNLKESDPCCDCRNYWPYYSMSFDHTGEKTLDLSKAVAEGRSEQEILAEIDNTELVCHNCHAIRTHNRGYVITEYDYSYSYSAIKGRERRAKNKTYVRHLKEIAACLDCKKIWPYYVLHFDHIRDKKRRISMAIRELSFNKLKEEISKCELVCANCHSFRTYNRLLVKSKPYILTI